MIPTETLARFIQRQQRKYHQATGELTELISSIAVGTKIIQNLIATAGFHGLHGYTGKTNVQGEETHKLDEEADSVLIDILGSSGHFGSLLSEERDKVVTASAASSESKYIVAFDPLDGSSNLGTAIPVGTIFSIWRRKNFDSSASDKDFLQRGRELTAAGYVVYGARTNFVYSAGQGVHGFTLDPQIGEYVLTDKDMQMPESGKIYSVNEANCSRWQQGVQEYVSKLKSGDNPMQRGYSARYVGSLVADFDRTLRKGGVFLYPSDSNSPQGKLRLLYECVPLAFIAEKAGGRAITEVENVLDVEPENVHQRVPFIVGGKSEVEFALERLKS